MKAWRAESRTGQRQTKRHQMSGFVAAGGRRVRGESRVQDGPWTDRRHQMSCFVAAGGRRVRGRKATFERLLLRLFD